MLQFCAPYKPHFSYQPFAFSAIFFSKQECSITCHSFLRTPALF